MNKTYRSGHPVHQDIPVGPVCPYCHSKNINLLQLQNTNANQLNSIIETMSPAAMASLGIKVSKNLGISPMLGGLIGVVVGGVVVFASQQILNKPYLSSMQCLCNDCRRSFVIASA